MAVWAVMTVTRNFCLTFHTLLWNKTKQNTELALNKPQTCKAVRLQLEQNSFRVCLCSPTPPPLSSLGFPLAVQQRCSTWNVIEQLPATLSWAESVIFQWFFRQLLQQQKCNASWTVQWIDPRLISHCSSSERNSWVSQSPTRCQNWWSLGINLEPTTTGWQP